ncbi:MAG: EAL domain-containing protein [Succinivibrio sp.]|nr:EAL domain-containing protein [Succinivibrio sp.]
MCLLVFQAQGEQFDREAIRVGFTPSKDYLALQSHGYTGCVYDFLENISHYSATRFTYTPCSEKTCKILLRDGKIDMIANVLPKAYFHERENITYSKHYLASTPVYLVAHENLNEKRGRLRIGYPFGYVDLDILKAKLANYNLKYGEDYILIAFGNCAVLEDAYRRHQVDAIPHADIYGRIPGTILAELMTQHTYLALRKNDQKLKELIDQASENLLFSHNGIREDLKKEQEQHGRPLILTPNEVEFLRNHRIISALSSQSEPPFVYYVHDNLEGTVASVMRMIENDLNIKINSKEPDAEQEPFVQFKQEQLDIFTDFICDVNWANEKGVRLTVPFLNLNYVAVTKKSRVLDLNSRIACVAGQHYLIEQIKALHPYANIIYYKNYDECLNAVDNEEADSTFVKSVTLKQNLERLGLFNLKPNPNLYFNVPISIAVNDESDLILLRILNKEIAHLNARAIQNELNNTTLSYTNQKSLQSLFYEYPLESTLAIFVSSLILITLLLTFIIFRQKNLRKIRSLAFYDQETGLPNLHYFEQNLPNFINSMSGKLNRNGLFVIAVKIYSIEELYALYSKQYILRILVNIVKRLVKEQPWIRRYGVSSEYSTFYYYGFVPNREVFPEFLKTIFLKYNNISEIRLDHKVGVCLIDKTNKNVAPRQIIDEAMLALKTAIKNDKIVVFYNENVKEDLLREKNIEALMNKALSENEFQLWVQPKFNIGKHKVIAGESLVRWQSPELGFLNPALFIDLFEKNGFIIKLDYYILRKTFELQRERARLGLPLVPISVNMSGLHMEDKTYLDHMRAYAEEFSELVSHVELEITETVLVDYVSKSAKSRAIEIVNELKKLNFKISMDDFGTGYSSIAMLQTFPIDEIKIDRELLLSAQKSSKGRKILSSVVNLGNDLDIRVITEGIETMEQEQMLTELGCKYGQGFMYSRPMLCQDFYPFIEKTNGKSQD